MIFSILAIFSSCPPPTPSSLSPPTPVCFACEMRRASAPLVLARLLELPAPAIIASCAVVARYVSISTQVGRCAGSGSQQIATRRAMQEGSPAPVSSERDGRHSLAIIL